MLAFAYAECGLSVDEFFDLSLYEWSLELHKARERSKKEFNEWESNAVFVREILSMIANANRDAKKKPTPFEGKDFIKLSIDKVEAKEVVEDVLKKYPSKLNLSK